MSPMPQGVSEANLPTDLGSLALDPCQDILAGSWGTWRLIYTAGHQGITPHGGLRLTTDTDTDWGIPQVHDPAAAEYLRVETPKGIHAVVSAYRMSDVQVRLRGRAMLPGEQITLTFGDTSGGGPGSRAQTTYERQHFFDLQVDVAGDGRWVRLEDRPCISIRGADAIALEAVAPSMVVQGEPFRILVRARDAWGNPSSTYSARVGLSLPGANSSIREVVFGADADGVAILEDCRLSEPGIWRVSLQEVDGALRAESNPIWCTSSDAGPRLYWGEPHGGQLHLANKIAEFFRYARDVSGLDFCGYQANDERLSAAEYATQQQAEVDAYAPGRFVPLPGYEWSATPRYGGHHNVYFRRFGQPIRRSFHSAHIASEGDQDTDLTHSRALHDAFRGSDTVITPHVGGGRADLTRHDVELERAIEVTSTHGTFEWFLQDALQRRYKVGFVGGSDGYTGRPGGEYPGFIERRFAKGGYTGLFAHDLTLPDVIDALRRRQVYATTGARMLITVDAAGAPMGAEITSEELPSIAAVVAGTAPIESIEIYRGLHLVHSHPIHSSPRRGVLRVLWQGAAHRDSYSAAILDGTLMLDPTRAGLAFAGPVEMLRFDSPRCWVRQQSGQTLQWHSITCGYHSGFVVQLDGLEAEAQLELVLRSSLATMGSFGGFGDEPPHRMTYTPMEMLRCKVALADLDDGPVTLELGQLDRRLTLSWAPGATQRDYHITFTDAEPQPGVNPYWLRVIQQDQEMAWTSPVFVDWFSPDLRPGPQA